MFQLIQVPRLYSLWREAGIVNSFAEYMDNLFQPLFECTAQPQKHLQLSLMLQNICGFDSVDDESGYGMYFIYTNMLMKCIYCVYLT